MKAEKRTLIIMSLMAALVLAPIAAYGGEAMGGPPPAPLTDPMNAKVPPIEQPLVPEGVFAVQLVQALKMGHAQDEAQAENMLGTIGIEPKNGWIAGYPVTPVVIGEIKKGVAAAADASKLGMGKDQALKAVENLEANFGLNVIPGAAPATATQTAPSGEAAKTVTYYKYTDKKGVVHYTDQYGSIPQEYRDRVEMIREMAQPEPPPGTVKEGGEEIAETQANDYSPNPNPEVINNYYYNDGPPVITYYAPPIPYYYLYGWVPYPFWSSGFFFPGFFILHDFHRHVFVHRHPFVVTNHVARANRVFVVDPVHRTLRGSMGSNRVASPHGFRSSAVQSHAGMIAGLSRNRMGPGGVSTASGMSRAVPSASRNRPQAPAYSSQSTFRGRGNPPGNNFRTPPAYGGRAFRPPAGRGMSFSSPSPRAFSAPSFSQGRVFSAHSNGGRSSFGGFHGGGGFGGRGGSFGGGSRGHR